MIKLFYKTTLAAIPDIAYYSLDDLMAWCEEINKSNIKVVSFSFQVVGVGLKASNAWKNYLLGFRYFCDNTDKEIKIIVPGISSYRRYEYIKDAAAGHKVSILTHSPYVKSRQGILMESSTKDNRCFEEILEENLRYCYALYKRS